MTDNPLLNAALAYAARGWQVFPCRPGLKVPLTEHGVKDATADPETIRAYWTRWPDANIALACGPGSGVYVVDVDVDEEKGVNGWESLADFPDIPPTVQQDSPRGGAHFLFKTDKPPRNKNSFRPGIDIRSEGYYIMLSPSIHPNGKVYAWGEGCAPGEIELAEFPDFMRPPERVALPWEKKTTTPPPPPKPTDTPIIERAKLYLAEIPPAVQGQAGHDSLLWAARALVVGFRLDDGTALSLLWSEFNPRCVPPWARGSPGDVKDFERKVSEARRTPGEKPVGWLLEEYGLVDHDNDGKMLEYGCALRDGLLAGKKPPEEPKPPKKSAPAIWASFSDGEWPDWLLNPPGMVGQLAAWINEGAPKHQPKLAVGAALTACGALFGRKVRDETPNGRTNLYMMGVARSSAGKDHAGDCVEQLFDRAGASQYLGGSRVTSDSAIEVALMTHPIQFFRFDEAGHFYAEIKQAGAGSGGAMHLSSIVPCFMSLYSSAHKLWRGKQRADGTELRRINQPHICIWAMTSPDVFFRAISKGQLGDGWLARTITIISHTWPKYEFRNLTPPPESLVSLVQAWATRTIPAPNDIGDIEKATGCFQLLIQPQPAARRIFEFFNDKCYAREQQCDKNDDDTKFLWGKGLQNARRVALTLAAGDRYDGAEITEHHAEFACKLVEVSIESFGLAIRGNVAENQWEADKLRLLKRIENHGAKGVSRSDLTRATKWIRDCKVRAAYVSELVEAGQVVVGKNLEKGRCEWLWAHPYGLQETSKGTK